MTPIKNKIKPASFSLGNSMDRDTSCARATAEAEIAPAAVRRAARFMAARAVVSLSPDDTQAEKASACSRASTLCSGAGTDWSISRHEPDREWMSVVTGDMVRGSVAAKTRSAVAFDALLSPRSFI
jgi:hypothetical protein